MSATFKGITALNVPKEGTGMNSGTYAKIWFLIVLFVVFVAGCGSNDAAQRSSAADILTYSLNGVPGAIHGTERTITVAMPFGTNVTSLTATYTSSGTNVAIGTIAQVSGTTVNNFTTPVEYTVMASDGTTAKYTVTVTVALNPARDITAYSLKGVAGTINKTQKTISVTLPSGTDVSALVATFTTTGGTVTVATSNQTSGTTANNFTSPVVYTVTAADSNSSNYTVTVIVASDSAKDMSAYSCNGVAGAISEADQSIVVAMPFGTNVTALAAAFSSTGNSVTVGTTLQESGTTPNNFTNPVAYTVIAADHSEKIYTVTVTVAAVAVHGPAPVNLGTAGNFVILAKTGVSTTGTTAVVGDIGLSPAAATFVTGFSLIADSTNTFSTSSVVTGRVYAANYAPPTPDNMTAAVSDMETAFTDAAGRPLPDYTELSAGNISGLTLNPGLYKWGTGVLLTSTGVTLTGGANDVWIFQIAGDLTVNNSAMVTLSGGAQPKNIFWQVSGQATLGTAANFKGIILSQTLISLNTGAIMNGRALAQTAVTLNATAITAP